MKKNFNLLTNLSTCAIIKPSKKKEVKTMILYLDNEISTEELEAEFLDLFIEELLTRERELERDIEEFLREEF